MQNNVRSWIISVYSLADPSNPVLLGSTPAIHYYNLSQDFIVTGTHVFVPVQQVIFYVAGAQHFRARRRSDLGGHFQPGLAGHGRRTPQHPRHGQ